MENVDLWLVAAATGAGYVAKYWKSLTPENNRVSESFLANSIHGKLDSQNLLAKRHKRTFPPLGNGVDLGKGKLFDEFFSESNDEEASKNSGSYENCNVISVATLPQRFSIGESFEENGDSDKEKSEFYNDSFRRVNRNRPVRSRTHGYSVKPLRFQLHKKHGEMEECVIGPLPSPSSPRVRPLLVTDGSRVISRGGSDSFNVRFENVEGNEMVLGSSCYPNIGLVELPRKPRKSMSKARFRRSSSSNMKASRGAFDSQGSPNGMLLFFLGISIGIMSTVVTNKREVDKLNKLLKQTENLVQDLHEELEMKDSLTVKELVTDDNGTHKTNQPSFINEDITVFSTHLDSGGSPQNDGNEPHDPKEEENFESMSTIEAELEAELERLELNLKVSNSKRISEYVELDPDFEADVVQGDLGLDPINMRRDSPSDLDRDASGTSTNHTRKANYAVSPRELSLRLHQVIQTRLEERISELETALRNSEKRVHSISHSEVNTSTQPSPTFVDEETHIGKPIVMNLGGEALDAYNKAYEEIMKMSDMGEDVNEKETASFDDGFDSYKIGSWEERTSKSWGSNGFAESEDEDDEIEKLLIKQIVEKTRQGSPFVINAQRMLNSMDDYQMS